MTPQRKLHNADSGYSNLAINIPLFYSLNQMPIDFNPARLDEGDGIEETLQKNGAQYHHSCRLLFKNTKLQRERHASDLDTVGDTLTQPPI